MYKLIILLLNYLTIINVLSSDVDLCIYSALQKYQNLINQYPEHKSKFDIMSNIPLSIWYTDRDQYSLKDVQNSLENCEDFATIVVLYALPNKDCGAGFSSGGSVKTDDDYKKFINNLNDIVNNKPIIYILEPDAIGLSLDNDCGNNHNYLPNMKIAIDLLSTNPNAVLYAEVSWWKLIFDDRQVQQIIDILKKIDPNNKLKGIATNVSNFRKNSEMVEACKKLNSLSDIKYKCMIDSSRNYNGPSPNNQWCNSKSGGIGELPQINYQENIDLIWIKPQIDLDGPCDGMVDSYEATGKSAGQTDTTYFDLLWEQGNPILKQCTSDGKD